MPCIAYDLLVEVRPWEFGSSPRSLREVLGVTRNARFPDTEGKPVEEDDWKAVFGKTERTV